MRFTIKEGQKYVSPGTIAVEGDASSASYFLGGAAITGGPVTVRGCGRDSVQVGHEGWRAKSGMFQGRKYGGDSYSVDRKTLKKCFARRGWACQLRQLSANVAHYSWISAIVRSRIAWCHTHPSVTQGNGISGGTPPMSTPHASSVNGCSTCVDGESTHRVLVPMAEIPDFSHGRFEAKLTVLLVLDV